MFNSSGPGHLGLFDPEIVFLDFAVISSFVFEFSLLGRESDLDELDEPEL